jgi:hypothetical protein
MRYSLINLRKMMVEKELPYKRNFTLTREIKRWNKFHLFYCLSKNLKRKLILKWVNYTVLSSIICYTTSLIRQPSTVIQTANCQLPTVNLLPKSRQSAIQPACKIGSFWCISLRKGQYLLLRADKCVLRLGNRIEILRLESGPFVSNSYDIFLGTIPVGKPSVTPRAETTFIHMKPLRRVLHPFSLGSSTFSSMRRQFIQAQPVSQSVPVYSVLASAIASS